MCDVTAATLNFHHNKIIAEFEETKGIPVY